MSKTIELIFVAIQDAVNTVFPYEMDDTKSFNLYLEPDALNRIVMLSYFMLFLTFNVGTGLTMGFNENILIPTGLSANRFAFIMFLAVYGYFKYSDDIYESAYRTAYEMDVVDREDDEVLNKVDPRRNEEVINVVEEVCDDVLSQVEDVKKRTDIEEVRRRIKDYFEGEEYVKQH